MIGRIIISVLLALLWALPVLAQALPETNEWESVSPERTGWHQAFFVHSITSDSPSPSGGGAVRFTYPAGTYSTSYGPGKEYYDLSPRQSDLYTGQWVRFSSGFTWHPISVKILYQYGGLGATALGSALPYVTVRTTSYGGSQCCSTDIGIQGNGAAGSLSKSLPHTLGNNKGSASMTPGAWKWLEVHVRKNTSPTVNDGVLEVWIDDVLIQQYSNILYFDKDDQFAQVSLAPEYGGGCSPTCTIPATQYADYDHTVIKTARIGKPGGTVVDTTPPGPVLNFMVQ